MEPILIALMWPDVWNLLKEVAAADARLFNEGLRMLLDPSQPYSICFGKQASAFLKPIALTVATLAG